MRILSRDDLVEVARRVLASGAALKPSERIDMVRTLGRQPDPGASDLVVARLFLAARGVRP